MKTKKPLIDKKGATALNQAITELAKEGAAKLKAGAEKPSITGIVDHMLIKGTFTRAEIMAEVARLRPDFKDPSAAVSNGMRRQLSLGNHPAIVEVYRERKAGTPKGSKRTKRNPDSRLPLADKLAKVDAWAARMDLEISSGFKRLAEFKERAAKEPRMRRVWP